MTHCRDAVYFKGHLLRTSLREIYAKKQTWRPALRVELYLATNSPAPISPFFCRIAVKSLQTILIGLQYFDCLLFTITLHAQSKTND